MLPHILVGIQKWLYILGINFINIFGANAEKNNFWFVLFQKHLHKLCHNMMKKSNRKRTIKFLLSHLLYAVAHYPNLGSTLPNLLCKMQMIGVQFFTSQYYKKTNTIKLGYDELCGTLEIVILSLLITICDQNMVISQSLILFYSTSSRFTRYKKTWLNDE